MAYTVINLGCGKTRIPVSIGVDKVKIEPFVDVVHDLGDLPYPFENGYANEIHMYHVLEHLDAPVEILKEIHRILKPGGKLHLRVPHFSSMGAFTDITHKRPFSYFSFDCFEKDHYQHFYAGCIYKILDKKIKYFGLYPNAGLYAKHIHPNKCFWLFKPFVHGINALIKISPLFFERFWCYLVGGATEIALVMKKPNAK